jgi:hypothetical protein
MKKHTHDWQCKNPQNFGIFSQFSCINHQLPDKNIWKKFEAEFSNFTKYTSILPRSTRHLPIQKPSYKTLLILHDKNINMLLV